MQSNQQQRLTKRANAERTELKPMGRPYKWDVLAKIAIGVNRELWLEKRWYTPDPKEDPHFVFVSVTWTVTDLGNKPTFQDIPETVMFNTEALVNLYNELEIVLGTDLKTDGRTR